MIALHAYHNRLLGVIRSLEERQKEIRDTKAREEQPTRLRLLQVVPDDMLPVEVLVAAERLLKAEDAFAEAELARLSVRTSRSPSVWDAWNASQMAALYKNDTSLHWRDMLEAHATEIEALHKRLCVPDCPWDGETIFPTK